MSAETRVMGDDSIEVTMKISPVMPCNLKHYTFSAKKIKEYLTGIQYLEEKSYA